MRLLMIRSLAASAALAAASVPAAGQHVHEERVPRPRTGLEAGAHAVGLVTNASPMIRGESRTEVRLTQPSLMGAATLLDGTFRARATLSLEALTMRDGELGAGAYGEGFVDRRHPHTYLHELVLSAVGSSDAFDMSLTVGRGFVPFGSDDPMSRPFVKFPVNHHLGQILERLLLIGGVRRGPILLEGALFNGNEPADANDLGSLDRFGDSWAGRATLLPLTGLELQVSHASVESPELPAGGGWDQRKRSASVRAQRRLFGRPVYALGEWKRTTQVERGRDVFSFGSVLAEASVQVRAWQTGVRLERSERPEEERLSDPFRTHWPHGGGHVLGITRWHIASVHIERQFARGALRAAPFIEASLAHVGDAVEGPFRAHELYGSRTIRTLNAGIRIGAGAHTERMGRYGVALSHDEN